MKMLHLAVILLILPGVLTQVRDWSVRYPDNPVCAVRGFSVSIPCSYYYPQSGHQVTQMLWCSMITNTDVCYDPPYVYNSSSNTTSDFMFTGDNKSDCSLLIHNVQINYSGEYKFRFITNGTEGRWTGHPGVTLQVTDLKVSLIRLSGNGTLKPGDSLNLTCDVNCTHTSSQFVWSKNNEELNTSGPVLHFPALTTRDSGIYTCTWKTTETSESKTISFDVEGESRKTPGSPDPWLIWIIVLVTVGVIVLVSVINWRRKLNAPEENQEQSGDETRSQFNQLPQDPDEERLNAEEVTYEAVLHKATSKGSHITVQLKQVPQSDDEVEDEGGVMYASVCVKSNKPTQKSVHTKQQQEEDSVIYSTVKKAS